MYTKWMTGERQSSIFIGKYSESVLNKVDKTRTRQISG